ncbi:formimidoylglutamate deiminase [Saccharothrix algeriensis]|uniref:Formimidoylglutamate deiminase n=1 Tax=Saccharothrix algeriensis TaxID=173560 RepID=A0A8T8HUU3_9PSEU|nr:formimidoylglutamate deiminase [Saccharothrix algeriensis]MBM7813031.1 formiminoglutamate deiminase [Saccharothrix algeriensis]QTR01644.1 formimidoylglutamate deiminase [Saccharothrix algeriensis]
MKSFWCERAWLPDGVASRVLVRTDGGRIVEVSTVDTVPLGCERLYGMVFPGFANAHSHAFHRALRGRTHSGGGTFWTWRERMYALAGSLTPEGYRRLATAVYAEMAVAGVTAVGEFHYLHDGGNEMGEALRQAAADAGIRLTLLDACYLAGGIGEPVTGVQERFSDGTGERWAERVAGLREDATTRVGAAIHSVRAVPRDALPLVAGAFPDRPLHVHLSEQPAENEACLAAYGRTPTELLHEAGALTPRTTAVHATHLSTSDIALLGGTATGACFCPTTEADLADGIGPARELKDAGSPLSLGSDQHAVVDPLLEARGLEHGERLRTGRRGRFAPAELVAALTNHAAIGWPEAGRVEPGAPADLVAVGTGSVRTAGSSAEQVVLTATASDVTAVVVGGKVVARDGVHATLGDVGELLKAVL